MVDALWLVEALDGEFDFIGLPVRVGGDEGVGDAFHLTCEGGGILACLVLCGFLLPPALCVFVLVTMVVGHVDDFGSLELESKTIGYELAAVGSQGEGFLGGLVGDGSDAGFCGFDGLTKGVELLESGIQCSVHKTKIIKKLNILRWSKVVNNYQQLTKIYDG